VNLSTSDESLKSIHCGNWRAKSSDGMPAGEAKGVKFLRMENHASVYAVGSGAYQFQSSLLRNSGPAMK
jgi:hypothetical protein